jgi:ABC-type ATPase involved in cell division
MIELNHVSKRYLSGPSDYVALRDVSFNVAKGEMLTVIIWQSCRGLRSRIEDATRRDQW